MLYVTKLLEKCKQRNLRRNAIYVEISAQIIFFATKNFLSTFEEGYCNKLKLNLY